MLQFVWMTLTLLAVGFLSYPLPTAASIDSGPQRTEVILSATEFSFHPNVVSAPAGEVRFVVKNKGSYPHGLAFEGGGKSHRIDSVPPGQSASLTLRFSEPGRLSFYCPVDGHRERGQEGVATITPAENSQRRES